MLAVECLHLPVDEFDSSFHLDVAWDADVVVAFGTELSVNLCIIRDEQVHPRLHVVQVVVRAFAVKHHCGMVPRVRFMQPDSDVDCLELVFQEKYDVNLDLFLWLLLLLCS